MAYVYQHIRLDTNSVFYIGIGLGPDYRRAYKKHNRNPLWNNIVKKTEYKVEILHDNISWEEACQLEKEYILRYGKLTNGGILSNFTDGGEGFKMNHSNETKNKISATLSNKTYEEIHGVEKAEAERNKRRASVKKDWENIDPVKKSERLKKISCTLTKYFETHQVSFNMLTCPYCGVSGKTNGMYRWHFENCKKK